MFMPTTGMTNTKDVHEKSRGIIRKGVSAIFVGNVWFWSPSILHLQGQGALPKDIHDGPKVTTKVAVATGLEVHKKECAWRHV